MKLAFKCLPLCVIVIALLFTSRRLVAADAKPAKSKVDPSDAFFNDGHIPTVNISLSKEQSDKLRRNPRV